MGWSHGEMANAVSVEKRDIAGDVARGGPAEGETVGRARML